MISADAVDIQGIQLDVIKILKPIFEELDNIVTDETDIVVKNTYDCYCYTNKRKTDYYYISGKHITNKFIIYKLIEQGLDLDCDHRFLEGFCKSKDSNCQFEIATGS